MSRRAAGVHAAGAGGGAGEGTGEGKDEGKNEGKRLRAKETSGHAGPDGKESTHVCEGTPNGKAV